MIHTLTGEYPSRKVWLDGKLLNVKYSQKQMNHSPDGFNWGYEGSGPSQLALAVMLELKQTKTGAFMIYQEFKKKVVARIPQGVSFKVQFDDETFWCNTGSASSPYYEKMND